jgi:hypothetical protein
VPIGVFCIESWSSDLRSKSTVRPILEFLAAGGHIRFIHQRVVTGEELRNYLDDWASRYDTYPVGFLAMHGSPGEVVAGSEAVTLEELIDATEEDDDDEWSVDLSGKVLYLGSCSTLRARAQRIDDLRRRTRARLVCGYERKVYWAEAAAFEVLLFSALGRGRDRVPDAIRWLHKHHGEYVDRLKFRTFPDYS